MAKEIIYKLDYRDDGKPLSKNIRINFISNGMRRDYFAIDADIAEGQRLANMHTVKMAEYEVLLSEKKDTESIMEEFADIKAKLESILGDEGSDCFEKRRIALCQKILGGNGFAKTDRFVQPEFWNESVDIETINEFLAVAINKDLDKVKKKTMIPSSIPIAS